MLRLCITVNIRYLPEDAREQVRPDNGPQYSKRSAKGKLPSPRQARDPYDMTFAHKSHLRENV